MGHREDEHPTPETFPASSSQDECPGRVVAILRNPRSGALQRPQHLWRLIRELRALGLRPRLFRSRSRLQRWMAAPQLRRQLRCLVAAGGDGTVGYAISCFPGVPVAVLPLGNENLVARYFRIRRDGRALARMIASGRLVTLDAGSTGERRFLLMLSVGADATVIQQVHEDRRSHISVRNYVGAGISSLFRTDWPTLRVTTDSGETIVGEHVWVFNLPTYAWQLPVAHGASARDGWLHLKVIRRTGVGLWRHLIRAALHRFSSSDEVIVADGRRFVIDSETPVSVQVDGDPAGTTPVTVEIVPRAVQLVVPDGAESDARLPPLGEREHATIQQ